MGSSRSKEVAAAPPQQQDPQVAPSAAAAAAAAVPAQARLPYRNAKLLARQSHFSIRDVSGLFSKFKELAEASPNPDAIHRHQFQDALKAAGIDVSNDLLLMRMFKAFDEEKNDTISFREFLLGLSTASRGSMREKMSFSFQVFDLDNTGQISRDEMVKLLSVLDGQARKMAEVKEGPRRAFIEQFVDEVFAKYDKEHNLKLSFDEYLRAVMEHPALAELDTKFIDVHVPPESPDEDGESVSVADGQDPIKAVTAQLHHLEMNLREAAARGNLPIDKADHPFFASLVYFDTREDDAATLKNKIAHLSTLFVGCELRQVRPDE